MIAYSHLWFDNIIAIMGMYKLLKLLLCLSVLSDCTLKLAQTMHYATTIF